MTSEISVSDLNENAEHDAHHPYLGNSVLVAVCTTLTSPVLPKTISTLLELERPVGFAQTEILIVVNLPRRFVEEHKAKEWALVEELLSSQSNWHLVYQDEPGIPHARNSALGFATSRGFEWLAFIDDDCVADPKWLSELVTTAIDAKAHVAAGKWFIEPVGEPSAFLPTTTWGEKHYQIQGRPSRDREFLPYAFTRSVLVRLENNPLFKEAPLQFDVSRVERGGSDVVFFKHFFRAGLGIVFSDSSSVTEFYSGNRLSLRWHAKRNIRNVQFRIERSLEGEPLWTRNLVLLFARKPLNTLSKFRVDGPPFRKELLSRVKRLTRLGRDPIELTFSGFFRRLGATAIGVSRAWGITMWLLGMRHRNYKLPPSDVGR